MDLLDLFCRGAISAAKSGMLTILSNVCLACGVTSMSVSCTSSVSCSPFLFCLPLYLDSAGLFDLKSFLAIVSTTGGGSLLHFSSTTEEIKQNYKGDRATLVMSHLGKCSSKWRDTHWFLPLSPPSAHRRLSQGYVSLSLQPKFYRWIGSLLKWRKKCLT